MRAPEPPPIKATLRLMMLLAVICLAVSLIVLAAVEASGARYARKVMPAAQYGAPANAGPTGSGDAGGEGQ